MLVEVKNEDFVQSMKCAATKCWSKYCFIDDIFLLWTGTLEEFNDFLVAINKLHPTIKFTASFDYEKKSTTFLDMTISVINGVIHTDLYKKETDKVQYLLPSSCHPSHIFTNIPYSLALRLVRICSDEETLNNAFLPLFFH